MINMRFITALVMFTASAMASNHHYGAQPQYKDYQLKAPAAANNGHSTPTAHTMVRETPAHTTTMAHGQPVASHPPSRYEAELRPPAAGPHTHTVIVGGTGGLIYTPSQVFAEVGDIVHFVFQRQNHSVTQSTFDKPCNRLEGGEDSGLLPNVNDTVVPAPTWQYTVKEKTPTWWYCKQRTGIHCGRGMVFAINPTAERTFDKFREVAIQINGTATTVPPAPERTVTDAGTPVTLINNPVATGGNRSPADAPYTAPGWNEKGDPKACNCACFCGVGTFPQGDGWNHYGGVGGSLSAPW